MANQRLPDRIKLIYDGHERPQNCIGAALTVFGISDFEHHISPYEAHKFISCLTEISELKSKSILVFENIEATKFLEYQIVTHMAVVIEQEPLKIMHRAYSMNSYINEGKPEYNKNAPFTETTLDELDEQYGDYTQMRIYC
ncbi:hypothetical protein GQ472_02095 [archaeon]|nr:hypothetical protein [archaeon]